jgi:predicted O-methyltransferase YrrM
MKTKIKRIIKTALLEVPFVNTRIKNYDGMRQIINDCGFEPGHFYSTIPDLAEVRDNSSTIFGKKKVNEVDLNTEKQINLLETFKPYYSEYLYSAEKTKSNDLRYEKEGAFYRYSDSVFLYCMMRTFKPREIIEIGSGHSSAIMLDTNEIYFDNKINLTFIEPYPEERLVKILKDSDKISHTIINKKVQSIDLDTFLSLSENDILFVDSTHVSKVGSDVNFILFEVLPALKPGVLIHFHDIFYPFEMPKHWVLEENWFWNENYMLNAFLMNNNNYEIVAFNTYLHEIKAEWFRDNMPECLEGKENTGSLWIRKLR